MRLENVLALKKVTPAIIPDPNEANPSWQHDEWSKDVKGCCLDNTHNTD
jgi:hypothetical protein